jgi:hypothetical protein
MLITALTWAGLLAGSAVLAGWLAQVSTYVLGFSLAERVRSIRLSALRHAQNSTHQDREFKVGEFAHV